MKEQIKKLKERNPLYEEILNFYEKILEAQSSEKNGHFVDLGIETGVRVLRLREGIPLLSKRDFFIDIPSSVRLFEAVCHAGKKVTEKLGENIENIEEAVAINALNLKELLRRHYDEGYLGEVAAEFGLDKFILGFLIHASVQPSLRANVEELKKGMNLKDWRKGYCPICGSVPLISELKDEGQRYYLCSFCGFEWASERLKCPFCENSDPEKLHYFFEEGKEAFRVDQCDNCMQYVKTVDSRKLDYEPDLVLEDIMTMHLDFLASEKGFKRVGAPAWGP